MTPRERFNAIMHYGEADCLPVIALEPYEQTAIERWRKEGLPEDKDPASFLGMSKLVYVPINWNPVPEFDQQVIEETNDFVVRRSYMGAVVKYDKVNPTMFYGHLDHPVKTLSDWNEYKKRFIPSADRLSPDWDRTVQQLNESSDPVGICLFPFFFRLGFYSMGMERFLTAFHEEPKLIHEMFSHWSEFVYSMLKKALGRIKIDFVLFAEDLAGKNGPLVSPAMYEKFWYPHQDTIVKLLRDSGVDLIVLWTAGEFEGLLPSLMEHGFNCTWILEKTAGMDAISLRKRFGRELRLGGNIAKEAVIEGPNAIDKEIERLMPLIHEGGFLPALDDMGAPDMPFSHYRYLIEKLKEIRQSPSFPL